MMRDGPTQRVSVNKREEAGKACGNETKKVVISCGKTEAYYRSDVRLAVDIRM